MKRLLIIGTLLAILPAALLVSCGEDKDEGPPIELQQTDRDRITEMARTYVAALEANAIASARALLLKGVPDATIAKSIATVRDEGFHLVKVGEPTADGQNAEVTVELTDKSGKSVTRKLEFRLADGAWVVYSPHLKPLS